MKIIFGAMLASCGFLLVPSIHGFVADKLGIKRQTLAFVGLIAVIILTFAILPLRGQYVLGLLFIAMASVMQWVVPRNKKVKHYISNILFDGVDIEDQDAPYSRVVNLFKLPLLGLGMWVILPWTVILLDFAAIGGALWYWYKTSNEVQKNERKNVQKFSKKADVA